MCPRFVFTVTSLIFLNFVGIFDNRIFSLAFYYLCYFACHWEPMYIFIIMLVHKWTISLIFQRMERDLHSFSEPFIFHFMPFFNQTKCMHHLNGPLNLTLQRNCDTCTIYLSQKAAELLRYTQIWLEMSNNIIYVNYFLQNELQN